MTERGLPKPAQLALLRKGDSKAIALLQHLESATEHFPKTVHLDHSDTASLPLQLFLRNPSDCNPEEDAWEILDPLLNGVAGWGATSDNVLRRI